MKKLKKLILIFFTKEVESQVEYHFSLELSLDDFREFIEASSADKPNLNNDSLNSTNQFLQTLNNLHINEPKPPPLECDYFEGSSKDKFEFHTFLTQLNTIIDSKAYSNSVKLSYLHTYLKGYARKLISHLSIKDENYPIAIDLLKEQFLDVPYIIDEIYKRLINSKPPQGYDPDFIGLKSYINEIRTLVYDLKTYNIEFMIEGSAGNSLLSHIVFNKLPIVFKKEIIHRVGNNYPSLNDLFTNYIEVVRTLTKVSSQKHEKPKSSFKSSNKQTVSENSTLQNFKTESSQITDSTASSRHANKTNVNHINKKSNNVKPCKFCQISGHSMFMCNKYITLEQRQRRARELNLCSLCSGVGHDENSCFGKDDKLKYTCFQCNSRRHIAAFCDQANNKDKDLVNCLCISFNQRSDNVYLLPTLTLEVIRGNKVKTVRCLVDSGSQRSYICENIAKQLCANYNDLKDINFDIQTFIGIGQRNFKQITLGLKLENQNIITMPLLVDKDLKLKYEVNGLEYALDNLKKRYNLADSSFYNGLNKSSFEIDALLGVDVLQFLPSFELTSCMNGSCFLINKKILPFGNIEHFLNTDQLSNLYKQNNSKCNSPCDNNVNNNNSPCINETIINSIISPLKTYFNPIEKILTDTDIDNGLENLFSFESMGISSSDQDMTDYDVDMVKKFKDNIEFKNGKYYVKLPWIEDKINLVPSNFKVALAVLNKVTTYLKNNNLMKAYDDVFQKQLNEDILEQISVKPHQINDYVYVPHRPVIRSDPQVTTKIRPVLNCSLKVNKLSPSLNEASYTGLDLMTSLLKLLFIFRTNNYVVLSDVKQAFLMIRLRDEFDKNKFCLLWEKDGQLVTYRYKTIVFGYTTSPFILHYVMAHHAAKFPNDKCTQILSSNFYCDNLIFTGNDVSELTSLYKLTYDRMAMGGFILRSWNSNSSELRNVMQQDDRLVEHSDSLEKILGYRFNTVNDTISLAKVDFDSSANSKRLILSETSRQFDPLGLALPVTIRGKLLIRSIWEQKFGWDDVLPSEVINEWQKLESDLKRLHEIEFPRQVINEKCSYAMHIFSDSSKSAYGFTAYSCNDNSEGHLLYSKAKVAPVNTKRQYSIPTLEFMGVLLALKCLDAILSAYSNIHFKFVNLCVDSQVVLNWMLSKETKLKSKYIKNRLKDFNLSINHLRETYEINFHYSYVNTKFNLADLVSRGINYKKFSEVMDTWLHGPEFLTNDLSKWPQYPLLSVSPDIKHLTIVNANTTVNEQPIPIFDITKFSSYQKVINITSYVFKPFCLKTQCNPNIKSLHYWIKQMQSCHFSTEIEYLSSKVKSNNIPLLVLNLNLFLDENNILRTKEYQNVYILTTMSIIQSFCQSFTILQNFL